MEIILANSAGFCFGVKRAIDNAYEEASSGEAIYSFGPLIHNEEVVKDLEEKGVKVLENEADILSLENGCVIIRSHGVARDVFERISSNANIRVLDCTCPFVKRIHGVVDKQSRLGDQIVIIGDAGHPEVEGIRGWCNNEAIVINSVDEAQNLSFSKKVTVTIVAQTTFNLNKFKEIVAIFENSGYDINVVNTICSATQERQNEAASIAQSVDSMIVIGSTGSSNSRKLYEICKASCPNTYFVQTAGDLEDVIKGISGRIGITAGASTPKNIIEEVQRYVRRNVI